MLCLFVTENAYPDLVKVFMNEAQWSTEVPALLLQVSYTRSHVYQGLLLMITDKKEVLLRTKWCPFVSLHHRLHYILIYGTSIFIPAVVKQLRRMHLVVEVFCISSFVTERGGR